MLNETTIHQMHLIYSTRIQWVTRAEKKFKCNKIYRTGHSTTSIRRMKKSSTCSKIVCMRAMSLPLQWAKCWMVLLRMSSMLLLLVFVRHQSDVGGGGGEYRLMAWFCVSSVACCRFLCRRHCFVFCFFITH